MKFNYNKAQGFIIFPIYDSHRSHMKGEFITTVRGFIFEDEKIIYIRINNFTEETDIKKKLFHANCQDCIKYLDVNYPNYQIYNSYLFNELPERLKMEINQT